MHLLERYATSCGVKIDKPYIYDKYFPLPFDKYITFQPYSKYEAKNYDYWEEVVGLLTPFLQKHNIHIIQIGGEKDKPVQGCYNLCGQTKIQQAAYIIKNGLLHLGADSFAAHIASGFNKKIVALYSNNNIENVKPYWSNEKDLTLVKANLNKKPSYSASEFPKQINEIKPELIAQYVLDALNIKEIINIKTLFIGKDFQNKTFEIVPDININIQAIPIKNPIVRMDYIFNEAFLENILKIKENVIIFTNKKINNNLITKYKQKISQVIYIIDENNDSTFVEILKKNLINYVLLSFLSEDLLQKYKLNYMDYNLIIRKDLPTKLININLSEKTRYRSSKVIISSEGQFSSKYDWQNKIKDKVIDDPEFWKEIDNFHIFELT
jgi:hypothetical protein